MTGRCCWINTLLMCCLTLPRAGAAQHTDSAAFAAAVRELDPQLGTPLARRGVAGGHASLRELYGSAAAGGPMHPIWTVDGRPTPQAVAVVALLATVDARGLRPADYDALPLGASAAALAERPETGSASLARFDFALSSAVMRLVADLHGGRTDPGPLRFAIPQTHEQLDLAHLVLEVSRAGDPATAIAAVEPRYAGYAALVAALARYRAVAADLAVVPPRFSSLPVRPGEALADHSALRRMLIALGDLPASEEDREAGDTSSYSPDLVAGIARFQRRHALAADGLIDKETARQLGVPIAARVRQIALTLERWRWLPDTPPDRYAVVNIPGFQLLVFEHDSLAARPVLEMSVIVGRAAGRHGTPVFSGMIDEVVFRPYWDVPSSIARKELLPRARRQPGVLRAEGFEIVGAGDEAKPVALTADNVERVAAGTLRLRQRPGATNALGLAKFVFPNSHAVYLHGTPAPELFARERRDFSHGCIRIADPAAFAQHLLDGQGEWTRDAIESAMQGQRTIRVPVARPVAVYILYATVTARADGVRFYPDIYGHDALLARALERQRRGGR